ncbi:hypothetical protein SKAU_G00008590 [Synaphobranchus kaupii]|uniref:Uncharacterized protein n=1 Tax=Synaphobranchus kaupii TaxID=118154 RepID=A0A9Q1JAZ6_SYNKA|nr:hypothetical protein SKAU_G00008590 [Synaphobranchus kaupii]
MCAAVVARTSRVPWKQSRHTRILPARRKSGAPVGFDVPRANGSAHRSHTPPHRTATPFSSSPRSMAWESPGPQPGFS